MSDGEQIPGEDVSDGEEGVRRRAYAIWEGEGRPEGRDLEHWRQAESEIGRAARALASPEDEIQSAKTPD